MKQEIWVTTYKDGTNSPLMFKYCLRCGRRLKTLEAQERGYGDVCWKKQQMNKQGILF